MRKSYPSDISRDKFEKIKPILESSRKKTRPRLYMTYFVDVLKSGCQWRMLPKDFPKWELLFSNVEQKEWREAKLIGISLKKISWRGPYQQWSERKSV